MNEIVGELVALVGGTASKTKSGGTRAGRKLSQADHLYHHIASAAKPKTAKAIQGQSVKQAVKKAIPLDDDEQLEHFNS